MKMTRTEAIDETEEETEMTEKEELVVRVILVPLQVTSP
jgi:hypothetical protein